jgi:hypothetical protein
MFNLGNVESEKSFSPINPGEAVPVKLDKVEITEDGHLDITFKGTNVDNAGNFKPRFWASDFDTNSERYNANTAEDKQKHIKQLLEAFLDNDAVAKVGGASIGEFYRNIAAALTAHVGAEASMKIVYKYNDDKMCVIPKYGAFISTEFRPRGLKLRDNKDQNGIPYDRVLPMSEYGVSSDTNNNEDALNAVFGTDNTNNEVPFGK